MKTIFLAPRATVDMLVSRCLHHAVLTETGDWLVVAEIPDLELRAAVLAAATAELPHPTSGAVAPVAAVTALAPAPVVDPIAVDPTNPAPAPVPVDLAPAPQTTRDLVEQAVARLGMPALLHLLDK